MSNVLRMLLTVTQTERDRDRKNEVPKRTERSAVFIHSESSCCLRNGTMNLEQKLFFSNAITSFSFVLFKFYALHGIFGRFLTDVF